MIDEGLRRIAVVVEDDSDIRNLLGAVLTQAGFQTHTASNGADGIEAVRRYDPVVTTLDVNLPGIDGFEVARRIRTFSTTYIVMVTARGDEIDTLVGLDAGADDYLTKPFRPRELRARIEAMLRRPRVTPTIPATETVRGIDSGADSGNHTASAAFGPQHPNDGSADRRVGEPDADWMEHDGLRLSPDMRVVERDGHRVALTRSEFELLLCVMTNGHRVVSKRMLALAMRSNDYAAGGFVSESEGRTVEVHLANLRRKLGDDSSNPRWIETVRGVGYRLADQR